MDNFLVITLGVYLNQRELTEEIVVFFFQKSFQIDAFYFRAEGVFTVLVIRDFGNAAVFEGSFGGVVIELVVLFGNGEVMGPDMN